MLQDRVATALGLHAQMVKQMKGVPGVKPDRLREAARPTLSHLENDRV